jgi:hypothetical protein
VFTGIVRELGSVESVEKSGVAVRLRVRAPSAAERTALGESVSVNGVCLTAVAAAGGLLDFDVVPETLRRSSLGRLEPGSAVNVEPALRAGEPLGGHLVQGHVDGVGRIARLSKADAGILLHGHTVAPAPLPDVQPSRKMGRLGRGGEDQRPNRPDIQEDRIIDGSTLIRICVSKVRRSDAQNTGSGIIDCATLSCK